MSRILRYQRPGAPFHITSRTQGHENWFTPELCASAEKIIRAGVSSAGAFLIGFAVMPNHLHIVLAQGTRTLGWIMQPILRRIALRVQRRHGVEGHVFERRFRSKICDDAEYLRTAILYTHHNPVKARICAAVADYVWTSHASYLTENDHGSGINVPEVLRIFAADEHRTARGLRIDYIRYMDWWCEKQRALAAGEPFTTPPPPAAGGDGYYAMRYGNPCALISSPFSNVDLRDRALQTLRRIAPDCDLELIRRQYGGRDVVEIRNQVIAALATAHYRGVDIANFLRVSPSTVSRIKSAMRWQGVFDE